jgi:leader peptidase (prepilin peptidase)/N-methyltransferase
MAAALLATAMAALLAAVTIADLRTRLIPNRLLVTAVLAALGILVLFDPAAVAVHLAWCGAAGAFLGAAHAARPEGMGLGDVKLAAVLGLYLGAAVVTALLVALSSGAFAGLVLILRHGRGARRRTLPFAPFLAIGAAVACLPLSTVGGWS